MEPELPQTNGAAMFDDNAFDIEAFEGQSWLFQILGATAKFVVRLVSRLVTGFSVNSEVE